MIDDLLGLLTIKVLWGIVGCFAVVVLLHLHRTCSVRYKNASLFDLICEDGRISARKFMEFGAFVICAVSVIDCTVKSEVPEGMVALLTLFASVFVLGRAAGQAIHTAGDTVTKRAAINSGKDVDIDIGEAPQDAEYGSTRRKRGTSPERSQAGDTDGR